MQISVVSSIEHDLFEKPVPTFPDHARGGAKSASMAIVVEAPSMRVQAKRGID
jgi:hypothetical protein